jgi:UDP-glucose 4-epimerase
MTDLGWEPKVSFEEGVSNVLSNIQYWTNAPLWDEVSIKKATEDWFKFMGRQK